MERTELHCDCGGALMSTGEYWAVSEFSCTAVRKISRDGRRIALAIERRVPCDEWGLCWVTGLVDDAAD
jgi:hypothetical protein